MTTINDLATIQGHRHSVPVDRMLASLISIAQEQRFPIEGDLDLGDAAALLDEYDSTREPVPAVRPNAGVLILLAMHSALEGVTDLDSLDPQKYGELVGLATAIQAAFEIQSWGEFQDYGDGSPGRVRLNSAIAWSRDAFARHEADVRRWGEARMSGQA